MNMKNIYSYLFGVYNCSAIKLILQFALFKSKICPLSVINRILIRRIFTGPKYILSWICNDPPNSINGCPFANPEVFIGIIPKIS